MQEVLLPVALQPGDTIGVVAPASNIKSELLLAGVEELKRLGYQVKYRDSILEKARYTAGSIKRRADEFNEMMADPEVKAIFAARGGYGAVEILEHIDFGAIAEQPKIVMGYSDITVLLIALYQKCNWATFHGPMVAKDFAAGASHYDARSFTKVLTRTLPAGPIDSRDTKILSSGQARGRLLGGCLPLIISLMGTPWELDTTDTILFLEDIGTKPYQIDRMLTQLRLAGKLQMVRGIVFGEMVDCVQHANQGYTIEEVLHDATKDLGIPVLFGLKAGHSEVGNITLPFGVEVVLDCQRGNLAITAPSVQF